ncbi:serine-tRNA ligase, variant [Aphanomyces invadans]|uniref:serine--tRNA ligase n=1 Tax=Aphanomyces invadans TaxID=157072 RepID=A0A024TQ63_9STRA|nr:serine-tRNA ligase, variant [Aphanomyces invadans]ETV96149.1 serine-tRNA ligase, variant [Aphanomyces invadans]|eukprot:XP_008875460.1 serine-tRNA ligase, variant [Aphanomyces invadans]
MMLGRVCRRSFSTPIKSRLDFKALSANLDDAIKNVAVRKSGGDPARVASLYTKLGSATNKVYRLRQERNLLSKQSGDIERGRALKAELTDLEASLETLTHELEREALLIPNHTHPDSPVGPEENSVVIRTIGTKPTFDFEPKDHFELATHLDILEMNTKIAGARFATLKNEGALLELALVHWSMAKLRAKGFQVHLPPDVAHSAMVEGCGFQPRGDATQVYSIANTDLCLVGTAEIPLAAMFSDTVLHTTKDLPKKVAAFGHCFRTEVGHGGKDTKGLYRIHQFSKVEMFAYCTLEDAEKLMDELLAVQVEMVSELGLHCQVLHSARRGRNCCHGIDVGRRHGHGRPRRAGVSKMGHLGVDAWAPKLQRDLKSVQLHRLPSSSIEYSPQD